MAAILNRPMGAIGGENLLGIGLLRRLAGDAVGGLTGAFAGLFMDAVPFDDKSLSNVREIQIVI
jgi:uncharacterized membrane protein